MKRTASATASDAACTSASARTVEPARPLPPQPMRMWKYNLRAFMRAVPQVEVAVLPAAWHDMCSFDSLQPSVMATYRLESQLAAWNVNQIWRVFVRPAAAATTTTTSTTTTPSSPSSRTRPCSSDRTYRQVTSTTEFVPLIFILYFHLLQPWACPHTPSARRAVMPVYRATTATPSMTLHWHYVTALLPGLEKLSRLFAGIHDVLVPDAAFQSRSSSSTRRKRECPSGSSSSGLDCIVASPWSLGMWQHHQAHHVCQQQQQQQQRRRGRSGQHVQEHRGMAAARVLSEYDLWLQFRWAPVAEFLWFLWWEAGWLRDLPFFLPQSLKHKALKNAFTVTILAVHMLLPLLPAFGMDLGAWYAAPLRRFLADKPIAALLTRQSDLCLEDGATLTSLPGVSRPHLRAVRDWCRMLRQRPYRAFDLAVLRVNKSKVRLRDFLFRVRAGLEFYMHAFHTARTFRTFSPGGPGTPIGSVGTNGTFSSLSVESPVGPSGPKGPNGPAKMVAKRQRLA